MYKFARKYMTPLIFYQKKIFSIFFKESSFPKKNILEYLFKKYKWHFLIIFSLVFLSLFSSFLSSDSQAPQNHFFLDSMVPKGFVLIPIEINNGKDIMSIMGQYGVIDLYAYSKYTGLPEKQAASVLKVFPPKEEEGHFVALVPEKEAVNLFEYSDSFYAVVQNPKKNGSKIYKKKKNKSLVVIEEDF